jgi:hypothetical protein
MSAVGRAGSPEGEPLPGGVERLRFPREQDAANEDSALILALQAQATAGLVAGVPKLNEFLHLLSDYTGAL